jgi:hypothetical protein
LLAAVLADVPLEERPRIAADRYAHDAPRSRREQALTFTQRRPDALTLPPAQRAPDTM